MHLILNCKRRGLAPPQESSGPIKSLQSNYVVKIKLMLKEYRGSNHNDSHLQSLFHHLHRYPSDQNLQPQTLNGLNKERR